MASFTYGWDKAENEDPGSGSTMDLPVIGAPGGARGSQVGSQTGGQGAGITPQAMGGTMSPTYTLGGGASGVPQQGYWGGPDAYAGNPNPSNQPGGNTDPTFAGRPQEGYWGGPTSYAGNPAPSNQPAQQPTKISPQTTQRNAGGFGDWQTMLQKVQAASDPQQAATARDQLARSVYSSLSDAGHDVKWQDQNTIMVDGRAYTVAGATGIAPPNNGDAGIEIGSATGPPGPGSIGGVSQGGQSGPGQPPGPGQSWYTNTMQPGTETTIRETSSGSLGNRSYDAQDWLGAVQQPNLPSDLQGWRPTTDTLYTPGDINFNDIPNYTRESLLGEMEGGETWGNTQSLLNDILKNPTALSDQVVDTLKAQQKNTLAEQQKQEEEDLRGFGASAGISDSNWLASQMSASRRGRDIGVAKAAQDVDIEAAKTRMGDKQAAANLGMQAGQLHSQNVNQATTQSLARAASIGDRTQLRESVKQAAAQMRISQDQVMSNFIGDMQRNLLTKYGIDVGAQIDAAKLNEQSAEFKEDLMFKMKQLGDQMGMAGRQLGSEEDRFATEMQYKYDVFNEQLDQRDWERRAIQDALGAS